MNKSEKTITNFWPCRFFFLQQCCRFGDSCAYSHSIPKGMTQASVLKQIPCPFFARGNCRYGSYCNLQHGMDSSNNKIITSISNYNQDSDSSDVCGICLEEISKTSNKYGLLSECEHTFCFTCLMEWRTVGSSEAQNRRSCPSCRTSLGLIVPSVIAPRDAQHKKQILQEYKQRLGNIKCKMFDGTLGSCKHGNECLYAHLDKKGEDVKSLDMTGEELYQARQQRRRADSLERDLVDNLTLLVMLQMGQIDVDDDDDDEDEDY